MNSSPKVNFKYQPLFSFAFKDFLTPLSSLEDINNFFLQIASSPDDFLNLTERKNNGNYPNFNKDEIQPFIIYKEVRYHHILENLLSQDDEVILIGLIRNPLSVISSWLHAPKEFRGDLGWNEIAEWRYAELKNKGKPEEFNGYKKWREVTLLFHKLHKQYPDRVYLLNYLNLLSNTSIEIKKLFNFCRIPVEEQTLDFIHQSSHSKNNNAYSVFRNNQSDDKWKNQLNPVIVEEIINDLKGTELEIYLNHDKSSPFI